MGLAVYRKRLFNGLHVDERWLMGAFALFSVVSLINFSCFPYSRMGHYRLEDYATFLFAIPLFLYLRQLKLDVRCLAVMFAIVACIIGCLSVAQLWSMKAGHGFLLTFDNPMAQFTNRPSGAVNPMRYAAISLILVGFSLNAMLFMRNKPLWFKCLLAFAVLLGGTACILTQVRGAWLALLALLGIYFIALFFMGHKKLMGTFIAGCIVALVFISQLEAVENRIERTEYALTLYFSGNSNSSVGARLDMFKAAWMLIQERPWFGHGLNTYSAKATAIRQNTPGMNSEVGRWHNPHNEILQVMVEKGVIGLLTLVLLFAAPVWLFVSVFRHNKYNPNLAFLSFSGLVVVVVYFFAGLSVALFEHDVFNHFYVLMIVLFAAQVRSYLRHQEQGA